MKLKLVSLILLIVCQVSYAQQLSVEKIMQDQSKWIGTSPSNIFWSDDSKTIYFSWNPDKNKGDSLYKCTIYDKKPQKVSPQERRKLPNPSGVFSSDRQMRVYEKFGDIFLIFPKTAQIKQLTNTVERESNPYFSGDETAVIFTKNNNLFALEIQGGNIRQLTNFIAGTKKAEVKLNDQEKWLKTDQLAMFDILKERKDKKEEADKLSKQEQPKRAKEIYLDDKSIDQIQVSPNLNYITYRLLSPIKNAKNTIVPSYVTESGFTEDISSRTKVGAPMGNYENFIYDIRRDSIYQINTTDIPGLTETPTFRKEYVKDSLVKKNLPRKLIISTPIWSPNGSYAIVNIRSVDNKDRWIMLLDAFSGKLRLMDRQHDDAWIGGPGIGYNFSSGTLAWLDEQHIYFQSEADGYSHLYVANVLSGEKKQLTKGKFEVQQVQLSQNKKYFYLTTNEAHPGQQHLYRMPVEGGERLKLTQMIGANEATLSPDENYIALRYSYINKPWELYLQANNQSNSIEQITNSLTEEFKAYSWKEAKVISFKARDGVEVFARIYEPKAKLKNKKAVIFVHGAGYLQNAHYWWSNYSREYMFHNLLVDKGYTVLDIDYRASAGYGRDCRTGIYRFMGGKDLEDNVDGAKLLVEKYGIDPKKIGIYGGSYGGFITLMAMFTTPDVFAAGAALRPVTDWAAYNHGYTANILNEPQTDSLAYRKSSPIYHAAGLKGHLLICHGMIDVNVHIQDSYRLVQRLIELKKENWEMASYPMEDHGFVEPTSWMDEYKRILKLFEERL